MVTAGDIHTRVVVVVEDDKPIAELLTSAINEEEGYRAINVQQPLEALRTLRQVRPDLLVLDIGLPEMSGFELYDRLRKDEQLRRIPVLFETAVSREQAAEFKKRGIRHVLQKPFDLNELIAGVKRLAPPRRAA